MRIRKEREAVDASRMDGPAKFWKELRDDGVVLCFTVAVRPSVMEAIRDAFVNWRSIRGFFDVIGQIGNDVRTYGFSGVEVETRMEGTKEIEKTYRITFKKKTKEDRDEEDSDA
ncbi:hypothetical protein ACFL2D_03220 [Patescibacteria group bacterium]